MSSTQKPTAQDTAVRETEHLPHPVYLKNWQGETTPLGQLTCLELDELRDWTDKYLTTWTYWRTPRGGADIDQLVRRMERMRGAIVDALPRVGAKVVASLLIEAGMTYEGPPGELAQLLGWEPSRHP